MPPRLRKAGTASELVSCLDTRHPLSDTLLANSLAAILQTTTEMLFLLDHTLRIVGLSRRAAEFFDYSVSELISRSFTILYGPRELPTTPDSAAPPFFDLPHGIETAELHSRQGISHHVELHWHRLGNKEEPFSLVFCYPGPDRDLDLGSDPETLISQVLLATPDPVFIVTGAERLIWACNEAAERLLGCSRPEILGLPFDRFLGNPVLVRGHGDPSRTTSKASRFYHTQLLCRRKDGTIVSCECTAIHLYGQEGNFAGTIVFLSDRSEEDEKEEELRRLATLATRVGEELFRLVGPSRERVAPQTLSGLGLSSRQVEIARAVLSGASSKRIGIELGISEATVKSHLTAIYRQLGVGCRVELVTFVSDRKIRLE